MTSAAVRFHPAAAQEAESTYDWYAARSPEAAHGFREELRRAIEAVATSPEPGPAFVVVRGGTCFRDTRSASYTFFAVTPSKSLRSPMAVAGQATGGPASDRPSNFRADGQALVRSEVRCRAAGVKKLVLSHFVPADDPAVTDDMLLEAARVYFRGEVILGKDLLEI